MEAGLLERELRRDHQLLNFCSCTSGLYSGVEALRVVEKGTLLTNFLMVINIYIFNSIGLKSCLFRSGGEWSDGNAGDIER